MNMHGNGTPISIQNCFAQIIDVGIDALPFGEWCNITIAAVAAVAAVTVAIEFTLCNSKKFFNLIPLMRRNDGEKKKT